MFYSYTFKHQISITKEDDEESSPSASEIEENETSAAKEVSNYDESDQTVKAKEASKLKNSNTVSIACLECVNAMKFRMKVQNTSLAEEADLRRSIKTSHKLRNTNQ